MENTNFDAFIEKDWTDELWALIQEEVSDLPFSNVVDLAFIHCPQALQRLEDVLRHELAETLYLEKRELK